MGVYIDLIVPTVKGREESLERCLDSYERNSLVDVVPIVVADSETCGWGWKRGLRISDAPYVLLACDDQECVSPTWAQICIETVDKGNLPCPRVWRPDGTIESQGGDMGSPHHVVNRPQKDWTEVDYTTIPFASREMIDEIGMLEIHYSSDVWVSYRGRQLGYKTVLRHGYDVRHWKHEVGRGAGMTVVARDAKDEATMRKELEQCES
jgi:hypothetical protein